MTARSFKDIPDVLTPEECMRFLSIGRNSLYRLLQDGRLKSVRIGRKYRIPKSAFNHAILWMVLTAPIRGWKGAN